MLQKTIAHGLFKKIKYGGIKVTYWDGDSRIYGSLKSPKLHITIKDPGVINEMAKNVSMAVGEAYMDERILVDGPLDQLGAMGLLNAEAIKLHALNSMFKGFNNNAERNQKSQIAHHYDLGNDFYKLWLDPSMTYTCAYFKTKQDSLEKAQENKRLHVLKKLHLEKGMTLLDIGCGWGALLIEAAQRYGAKGLGVTLSEEQFRLANEKIKKLGLQKLVEVRLMNYLDIPKLKRRFDRVVSVGFFEAVGRDNLDDYFSVVDDALKLGGVSVLHTITNEAPEPTDAWNDKYIFPGAYIPNIPEIAEHLSQHHFYPKDFESLGQHYAMTLRKWWTEFEKHKGRVIDMYDERFYRMWRLYLAESVAAFEVGFLGLSQWTFTKGYSTDWPMTRDYLYK